MALYIKVGVVIGTDAPEAIAEMVELAAKTGVSVEAKFNDVTIIARPYELYRDVLAAYERGCRLANYPSS